MATVQFTLTDEENARFQMMLRELQLFDPSVNWTAGSLAKSLCMSIVDDDLESHSRPDDEGEVVVVH